MRLLKTTACFLLLFQTFDLAMPQTTSRSHPTMDPSWLRLQTFDLAALQTTSRPRPTIDPSWLRQQLPAVSAFSGDGDSTNDSGETTSGALDEDASTNTNETDNDGGFVQTTVTNVNLNETNQQQQPAETNGTESLNSTQTNTTEWIETNSTNAESALNATDIPATTPSGHNDNATMASNDHMSPNTTLIVTPQQNATTNTSSAPPDAVTTATEDGGVTTPVLDVSVKINVNDQGSGDESGREGSVSDSSNNHRKVAWAAVLGTGIVVAFIGLVVYVMLKRKQRKDFYHRKLVEEFPSDPVHRLDNGSLELEFGRSAFYNQTLQEDDIQMSNFPKRI